MGSGTQTRFPVFKISYSGFCHEQQSAIGNCYVEMFSFPSNHNKWCKFLDRSILLILFWNKSFLFWSLCPRTVIEKCHFLSGDGGDRYRASALIFTLQKLEEPSASAFVLPSARYSRSDYSPKSLLDQRRSRRVCPRIPPGIWVKNTIYHPKVGDFVFCLTKFQEGDAYQHAASGADP